MLRIHFGFCCERHETFLVETIRGSLNRREVLVADGRVDAAR